MCKHYYELKSILFKLIVIMKRVLTITILMLILSVSVVAQTEDFEGLCIYC